MPVALPSRPAPFRSKRNIHYTLFLALLFPKEVCYQKYGCFKPHPNPLVKQPQSPSEIGVRFNLFTRENRNSATLIDDENESKLSASHFIISRPLTIFVIHGFTGKSESQETEKQVGHSLITFFRLVMVVFFVLEISKLIRIWTVLLIVRAARKNCFNQSQALPSFGKLQVIIMDFCSHSQTSFEGKPVGSSPNDVCFLRLYNNVKTKATKWEQTDFV